MPRRVLSLSNGQNFGAVMARLRRAAGFSQRELASELGISSRMIAYYETHIAPTPSYVLPHLAKVLGISVDELLGVKPIKNRKTKPNRDRMWRRFKQVGDLPPRDRRQIVQFIDMALDRARLKEQKA